MFEWKTIFVVISRTDRSVRHPDDRPLVATRGPPTETHHLVVVSNVWFEWIDSNHIMWCFVNKSQKCANKSNYGLFVTAFGLKSCLMSSVCLLWYLLRRIWPNKWSIKVPTNYLRCGQTMTIAWGMDLLMNSSLSDLLDKALECPVCLEQLDDTARVLPCQHTFCRRCLLEIVHSRRELLCPECRVQCDLNVDDLPPNILLIRLLEGNAD